MKTRRIISLAALLLLVPATMSAKEPGGAWVSGTATIDPGTGSPSAGAPATIGVTVRVERHGYMLPPTVSAIGVIAHETRGDADVVADVRATDTPGRFLATLTFPYDAPWDISVRNTTPGGPAIDFEVRSPAVHVLPQAPVAPKPQPQPKPQPVGEPAQPAPVTTPSPAPSSGNIVPAWLLAIAAVGAAGTVGLLVLAGRASSRRRAGAVAARD